MNILTTILTHHSVSDTLRAWHTSENPDTVIVCNSTDNEFYSELTTVLPDAVIHRPKVVINTPGGGKQACWDYFLSHTQYDYICMLDGDDVFVPGAWDIINNICRYDKPNVMLLRGEDIIMDGTVMGRPPSESLLWSWNKFPQALKLTMTYLGLTPELQLNIINFFEDIKHNQGTQFERLICCDRLTAQTHVWDVTMKGCEDVKLNWQLRLDRDIRVMIYDTSDIMIYIKKAVSGTGTEFVMSDFESDSLNFNQSFTSHDLQRLRSDTPNLKTLPHTLSRKDRLSRACDIINYK